MSLRVILETLDDIQWFSYYQNELEPQVRMTVALIF